MPRPWKQWEQSTEETQKAPLEIVSDQKSSGGSRVQKSDTFYWHWGYLERNDDQKTGTCISIRGFADFWRISSPTGFIVFLCIRDYLSQCALSASGRWENAQREESILLCIGNAGFGKNFLHKNNSSLVLVDEKIMIMNLSYVLIFPRILSIILRKFTVEEVKEKVSESKLRKERGVGITMERFVHYDAPNRLHLLLV